MMRVIAAAVAWGPVLTCIAPPVLAQIAEVEFQRELLGRIDSTRAAAMQSIGTRASDRRFALPLVAQSLIELAKDDQFEYREKRGLSDLPEGVQLMFQFVGASDHPAATRTLLGVLQCRRFSWRMAALNQLCRAGSDAAVLPVIALIDSPDFQASYGFRFSLARGLTRFRHPRAWFALANLYQQVDGQLAHRLHQTFSRVTVADFRGDRQSLQRWRQLVGVTDSEEDSGPDRILSSDQNERMRLKPSKYYGIDIYAQRLLFVIDCSGSMTLPTGESTRLAKAKQELTEAIRGLDERCEFGIVGFRRHVYSWKDQLVTATEESKREAIEFVSKMNAADETNTYGALRESLEFDDQLEAMFVLTDGEPTCGAITKRSEILADILQRNETRHITINTVALAVDPRMQRFLRELSLPSEGEFRIVN